MCYDELVVAKLKEWSDNMKEKQRKFGFHKLAGVGLVSCMIGVVYMNMTTNTNVYADASLETIAEIPHQDGVHVSMDDDGIYITIDDDKQFAEGETIQIVDTSTGNESVFPTSDVRIRGNLVGHTKVKYLGGDANAKHKNQLIHHIVVEKTS